MRVYQIQFRPICKILDDRKCDCGMHTHYSFLGIEAKSRRSAIRIARNIVQVSAKTHALDYCQDVTGLI